MESTWKISCSSECPYISVGLDSANRLIGVAQKVRDKSAGRNIWYVFRGWFEERLPTICYSEHEAWQALKVMMERK